MLNTSILERILTRDKGSRYFNSSLIIICRLTLFNYETNNVTATTEDIQVQTVNIISSLSFVLQLK